MTTASIDPLKDRYRSITDLVVDALRRNIIEGKYAPGAQLKEREVALEIGVSTTPVKAALQRLALEGLVTSVPMRGSFVAENLGTQISEFGLIRAALEGTAAYLAAVKADADGIERLRRQIETMERLTEARDLDGLIAANAGFHDIIQAIAGNPTLRQISEMVRYYDTVTRRRVLADEGQMLGGLADHQAVFAAIERRSPLLADERMRSHVLRTTDFLKKHGSVEGDT